MMVDMHCDDHKPNAHYEMIVDEGAADNLRKTAFASMAQLTGWCSEGKASTLLDYIRLTRPEVIVEIGVWGGKSLVPMAHGLRANGRGKIYGIDPWKEQESGKGMDGENLDWWTTKAPHEAVYQELVKKIEQFNLQEQIVLVRETSEKAPLIENIGLLHIDGNHSEEASFIDVTKWVPQVKSGGYIVFDDVNWSTTGKAVAWLNENCIPVAQFKGDNIWGIWQKK